MYPTPIYKRKKDILSFILLFLVLYSLGKGITQATGGTTLGGLFRIFLPSAFYFGLFTFLSLINLEEINRSISLPDIKFKQFGFLTVLAVLVAYIAIEVGQNWGLTYSMIGLLVIISFFLSVYLVVSGNMIYGIGVFLLSMPLLNFLAHDFRDTFVERIELGPVVCTPISLFLVIITLLWVIKILVNNEELINFKNRINTATLVFFFVCLLSVITSKDASFSSRRFALDVLFPIIFFFLISNNIKTKKDLIVILYSVIASLALMCLISWYFFFHPEKATPDITSFYGARLFVNLTSENLGGELILVMPIVIVLASLSSGYKKLCLLMISIFFFFTCWFTYERSILAILLFSVMFLLVKKSVRWLSLVLLLIPLFVFIFYSQAFYDFFLTRFKDVRSFQDIIHIPSLAWRVEAWKDGLHMLRDHPFFGIGFGMWGKYVHLYSIPHWIKMSSGKIIPIYISSPHNFYLHHGVQAGILGLITFVYLLVTIMKEIISNLICGFDQFQREITFGLLISFTGFIIFIFFAGGGFAYRYNTDYGILFWMLVGIVAVISKLQDGLER